MCCSQFAGAESISHRRARRKQWPRVLESAVSFTGTLVCGDHSNKSWSAFNQRRTLCLVNALPDVVATAHPYPLAWAGRWLLNDQPSVNVDVRRRGDAAPKDRIRFRGTENQSTRKAGHGRADQQEATHLLCPLRHKVANATLVAPLSQGAETFDKCLSDAITREMKPIPSAWPPNACCWMASQRRRLTIFGRRASRPC